MKSAKYKPECDTCVMYLQHNHICGALTQDANDKNGKCKFRKSTSEYTLKYKSECDTCVMHLQHNHICGALTQDANDKNGKCKFRKSTSEYTLKYNKYVDGYVPERITDED